MGNDLNRLSNKLCKTWIKLDNDWNASSSASQTSFLSNSGTSLFTPKKGTWIKILTLKKMLQKLPIALARVKASNNSKNLLNEIRQIVYSLHQLKKLLKKYEIT